MVPSQQGGLDEQLNSLSVQLVDMLKNEKLTLTQLLVTRIYLSDAANFKILGADSIYEIAPVMLEIFEAPYGTDLCWLYEEGVHVGFYDLIEERETTIEEILSSAN